MRARVLVRPKAGILDPQGHVASWNTGAQRLKGYTAEEIIGRHFSTFYTREAVDRGWDEYDHVSMLAQAQKATQREQQLAQLFPDGKTLHLPSNGKPLAGAVVSAVGATSMFAVSDKDGTFVLDFVNDGDAPALSIGSDGVSGSGLRRPIFLASSTILLRPARALPLPMAIESWRSPTSKLRRMNASRNSPLRTERPCTLSPRRSPRRAGRGARGRGAGSPRRP